MSMTTDFQEWLRNLDPEDHEEVHSLYQAVNNDASFGIFDVKPARGGVERWIVTVGHMDQQLLIASADAKKAFLHHLTKTYCHDMDMAGWHGYEYQMAKDD